MMTAEELWSEYCDKHNIRDGKYSAWAFGGDPDLLAGLVLDGIKSATSSAYPLYEIENEKLPEAGLYSIVLDSRDNAVCVIRTTDVYISLFRNVSSDHAYKEGEGDKSLAYWKDVHQKFFSDCLKEAGFEFSQDMKVVCEEFEVVYRP